MKSITTPVNMPAIGHSVRGRAVAVEVSVSVDANHCHFYAICAAEAPEVFQLPSDGRLRYTAKPAAVHTAAVLEAARLCPMQAIHVKVLHHVR